MPIFNKYIAIDWSAKSVPSPKRPSKDSLWISVIQPQQNRKETLYFQTRYKLLEWLENELRSSLENTTKTIVGYDFDFGCPAGLIDSITQVGQKEKWRIYWDFLTDKVVDNPDNSNNRFEVANEINQLSTPDGVAPGPFWGIPVNARYEYISAKKSMDYPFETKKGFLLDEYRHTEKLESRAQPVWKLIGSASVGGQSILGVAFLNKLRFHKEFEQESQVWPFENGFILDRNKLITHVEIWPGIFSYILKYSSSDIKDQAQVLAATRWMSRLDAENRLGQLFARPRNLGDTEELDCISEEGWILGMGLSKEILTSDIL